MYTRSLSRFEYLAEIGQVNPARPEVRAILATREKEKTA